MVTFSLLAVQALKSFVASFDEGLWHRLREPDIFGPDWNPLHTCQDRVQYRLAFDRIYNMLHSQDNLLGAKLLVFKLYSFCTQVRKASLRPMKLFSVDLD